MEFIVLSKQNFDIKKTSQLDIEEEKENFPKLAHYSLENNGQNYLILDDEQQSFLIAFRVKKGYPGNRITRQYIKLFEDYTPDDDLPQLYQDIIDSSIKYLPGYVDTLSDGYILKGQDLINSNNPPIFLWLLSQKSESLIIILDGFSLFNQDSKLIKEYIPNLKFKDYKIFGPHLVLFK